MSSVKNSNSTQVRKSISFSKKRDKVLLDWIDKHDDDFSYNTKELMKDGLRYRQLMQQSNPVTVPSMPLQSHVVVVNEEVNNNVSPTISTSSSIEKNDQWDELDDIELKEKIDEDQLEKNLDDF
jgi:hypothetical protein